MSPRLAIGAVLIVAGAVLALFFPELRFLWFQGRPLGIVLIVVGAIDVAENLRRSRGRESRSDHV